MLPSTNTETHVLISICTPENAYPRLHDAILSTKYSDDESELAYFGYRYYSPELGRFVSRDPIGGRGGENAYAFVRNAPSRSYDLLGLLETKWIIDMYMANDDWNASENPAHMVQFFTRTKINAGTSFEYTIDFDVERPHEGAEITGLAMPPNPKDYWNTGVAGIDSGYPSSYTVDGWMYGNLSMAARDQGVAAIAGWEGTTTCDLTGWKDDKLNDTGFVNVHEWMPDTNFERGRLVHLISTPQLRMKSSVSALSTRLPR